MRRGKPDWVRFWPMIKLYENKIFEIFENRGCFSHLWKNTLLRYLGFTKKICNVLFFSGNNDKQLIVIIYIKKNNKPSYFAEKGRVTSLKFRRKLSFQA